MNTILSVQDDLSVNGDISINGYNLFSGKGTKFDLGETQEGVFVTEQDTAVSNDMTIGGNLSVGGTIYGLSDDYVNATGDTMTGTLTIDVGGSSGLDVNGDIEYSGELRNQSPVKIADGLNITNLGGINGGQLLLRDVIVSLDGEMYVENTQDTRELVIPEIMYLRFAKTKPVLKTKTFTVIVEENKGKISLPISKNAHIVKICKIITTEEKNLFKNNIGLDSQILQEGDFRISGQNSIDFWCKKDKGKKVVAEITVAYREDLLLSDYVEKVLPSRTVVLEKGWFVVCLTEKPLDMISAHDTAAMSPRTEIVMEVVPIREFVYSADSFVVGVIAEDGTVNQYF